MSERDEENTTKQFLDSFEEAEVDEHDKEAEKETKREKAV
jgi:hypothetical protein